MSSKPRSKNYLDYLAYSDMLEDSILNSKINRKDYTDGALGQIDLVESTSFIVRKTKVATVMNNELQLFDTNLAADGSGVENDMLLTRYSLLKRDLVYNVQSIAYVAMVVGRLRSLADWFGLEVLGTEGDKIRVYGRSVPDVVKFCLCTKLIFEEKNAQGIEGLHFRCGICALQPGNHLSLYRHKNRDITDIFSSDGPILDCTDLLETQARSGAIILQENVANQIRKHVELETYKGNFRVVNRAIRNSSYYPLLERAVQAFFSAEEDSDSSLRSTSTITKKMYIAFGFFQLNENYIESIKEFVSRMRHEGIGLMRLGAIKEGKITFIAVPKDPMYGARSLLTGFQNLIISGLRINVGLAYDFLWVGNITFDENERAKFDFIGSGINLAARIGIYANKRQELPKIYASETFVQGIIDDGVISSTESIVKHSFYAKGFDTKVNCYNITSLPLQASQSTGMVIDDSVPVAESVSEMMRHLSNILYGMTRNYPFSVNGAYFLVSNILLFSGHSNTQNPNLYYEEKRNDFFALARLASSRLLRGEPIVEVLELLIAKTPDLLHIQKILRDIPNETCEVLTKFAVLTFGRIYDFRIETVQELFDGSLEELSVYEKQGVIQINWDKKTARLLPPLAYIFDLRAPQDVKYDTHAQVTEFLMKNLQAKNFGDREWYERGRVFALHARFAQKGSISSAAMLLLFQVIEYAWENREFLDLIILEPNVMHLADPISRSTAQYIFAYVNLRFGDYRRAILLSETILKENRAPTKIMEKSGVISLAARIMSRAHTHPKRIKEIEELREIFERNRHYFGEDERIVLQGVISTYEQTRDSKISLSQLQR